MTRLLRLVWGPPTKESLEVIKACFDIEELIVKQALPLHLLMTREEERSRLWERIVDIDMIEIEGPLSKKEEDFVFNLAGARVIIEPVYNESREVVNYRKVERRGRLLANIY